MDEDSGSQSSDTDVLQQVLALRTQHADTEPAYNVAVEDFDDPFHVQETANECDPASPKSRLVKRNKNRVLVSSDDDENIEQNEGLECEALITSGFSSVEIMANALSNDNLDVEYQAPTHTNDVQSVAFNHIQSGCTQTTIPTNSEKIVSKIFYAQYHERQYESNAKKVQNPQKRKLKRFIAKPSVSNTDDDLDVDLAIPDPVVHSENENSKTNSNKVQNSKEKKLKRFIAKPSVSNTDDDSDFDLAIPDPVVHSEDENSKTNSNKVQNSKKRKLKKFIEKPSVSNTDDDSDLGLAIPDPLVHSENENSKSNLALDRNHSSIDARSTTVSELPTVDKSINQNDFNKPQQRAATREVPNNFQEDRSQGLLNSLLKKISARALELDICEKGAHQVPARTHSGDDDVELEIDLSGEDEAAINSCQFNLGINHHRLLSKQDSKKASQNSKPIVRTRSTCGLYQGSAVPSARRKLIGQLQNESRILRAQSLVRFDEVTDVIPESQGVSDEDERGDTDDDLDLAAERSKGEDNDLGHDERLEFEDPDIDPAEEVLRNEHSECLMDNTHKNDEFANDCDSDGCSTLNIGDEQEVGVGQTSERNATNPSIDGLRNQHSFLDIEAEEDGISNPSASEDSDGNETEPVTDLLDESFIQDDNRQLIAQRHAEEMDEIDRLGLEKVKTRFAPLSRPNEQNKLSRSYRKKQPNVAGSNRPQSDEDEELGFDKALYFRKRHVPRESLKRLLIAERKVRNTAAATVALNLVDQEKQEERVFKSSRNPLDLCRMKNGSSVLQRSDSSKEIKKWIASRPSKPGVSLSRTAMDSLGGKLSLLEKKGSFLGQKPEEVARITALSTISRTTSLQKGFVFDTIKTEQQTAPGFDTDSVHLKRHGKRVHKSNAATPTTKTRPSQSDVFRVLNQNHFINK